MKSAFARLGVALALVGAGIFVFQGVATAENGPTFSLTVGGQPAASVSPGDTLRAKISSPVVDPGAVAVELMSQWEPESGQIGAVADVVAPEGWTVTYTTDGSTWGAAPANLSTVAGVKASGTVASDGYASGRQSYAVTSSATVRPSLGSFQGSSGGDGWDVFHGLGKVFNVYHHNQSQLGIDCHERTTGAYCWEFNGAGGAYFISGYTTGARSTGYVDESSERLWALVKRNSDSKIGFMCVDVSGALPTECSGVGTSGFVDLATTTLSGYNGITDLVVYSGKLWTKTNDANSPVLCLDLSTASACGPYTPAAGYTSPSGGYTAGRIKAFAGRMYITSNNSQFDCFDMATLGRCVTTSAGTWPKTSGTFSNPIFAVTSGGGSTIAAVCTHNNTSSCFTPGGESYTYPSGLPATSDSSTAGWGDNYNLGDKYYYVNGYSSFGCWDFSTNLACAGYSSATLGNYVYAVNVDPLDANCLWSNSDNGQIKPFNATTGVLGCTPPNGTVDFAPSTFVPRLTCASSDRVTAWKTLTISPPNGILSSDARLTVLNGGSAVSGWNSIAPVGSQFDLSALTTQLSGPTPTFAVEFLGSTANQLTGTSGTLRFEGGAPELCVDLDVQRICPSGNGQHSSATVPGAPVGVTTSALVGGVTTSASSSASAAPVTGCLATLSGSLTETGSNSAVSGAEVSIMTSAGARVATTSAVNGSYSISNMFPGTYLVVFGPSGTLSAITPASTSALTANATTTKNGTYGSSALKAPTVERTVYPNVQANFALAPTGGTGTVSSSATSVLNPATGQAVSQLVSSGQPTWTVNSGSSIGSGGIGTTGTYYAVYKVETSGGDVAHGLLKLNVIPQSAPPFIPVPPTTVPTTNPPSTSTPPSSPPVPVTVAPGVLPELRPGQSEVHENGAAVPVVVEEIARGQWRMSGRDFQWTMEIPEGDTPGSADGVVTLISNRDVIVGGYGFEPNSYVDVWMLDGVGPSVSQQAVWPLDVPARYLGSVLVHTDGTFEDPLLVPAGVEPGPYTLQANGRSFDGVQRSLNLGVQVLPSKMTLPVTGRQTSDSVTLAPLLLILGFGLALWSRRRSV